MHCASMLVGVTCEVVMRVVHAKFWVLGLVFVLLGGVSVHAEDPPVPITEPEFLKALEDVRTSCKKGQCKSGIRKLESALELHKQKPYVVSRRIEIQTLARRLAFGAACPPPKPKTLVSGKLVRYRASSGSIKIYYTPQTMQDWRKTDQFYVHKAGAVGPIKIVITGKHYPPSHETSPALIFGNEEHPDTGRTQLWTFVLGSQTKYTSDARYYVPRRVLFYDGDDKNELYGPEWEPSHGKFKVELNVRTDKIEVRINKDKLGPYKKPKTLFGQFGLSFSNFDKIELSGKIEPSWIQGQIDKIQQGKREKFTAGFKPEDHLPAWLLESGTPGATGAKGETAKTTGGKLELREYPPSMQASQRMMHAAVYLLLMTGQNVEARQRIDSFAGKILPAASKGYLRAISHLNQHQLHEAIAHAQRATRAEPEFLAPYLVESIAQHLKGDKEAAKAAMARVTATRSLDDAFFGSICANLMRAGKLEEAKSVARWGSTNGLNTPEMKMLHRALLKASNGPEWRRTYEHKSKHYHVLSDIDKKTCVATTKELERMYRLYERTIERDKGKPERRFRVYLFSGRDGFLSYMSDLAFLGGSGAKMAAGVYSTVLKQLVIWNLPQRKEMMGTVRHEGLHQYLDQRLPYMPAWFNEGLAVYYEYSGYRGYKLHVGDANGNALRMLKAKGFVPLKEFMAKGYAEFYATPHYSYSQAWLLMHMLREEKQYKTLFKKIWEALSSDDPNKSLDAVLTSDVVKKLENALDDYLHHDKFG